jgi:Sec7-like guanine-nucleotide exchange factor
MLQTNLHNPAVKEDKRMTKDQFIRQNKGISADGELSDDLLSEIYDKIAAEPISLQGDAARKSKKEETSFTVFSGAGERKKKDAFNSERKEMMRQSEALIRQKKSRASVFVKTVSITDDVYVKSMYEVVWPPVLGAISFILDSEDDQKLLDLSLTAFNLCISLACTLDFPIARNTFVNALTKFTALDTVKEMRGKQIACIKLMLNVAVTWGDNLEESWNQILLSFSHLARLQHFALGQNDDPFQSDFSTNGNQRRTSRLPAEKNGNGNYGDSVTKFFMGITKAESVRIIEETNADFVAQNIDPEMLDRIFLGSTKLSGPSVLHFVRSLCVVSLQEISTVSNTAKSKETGEYEAPRIFSLQKLVEVADSNMTSRSRVDWANIWNLLAKHFTSVGLHENMAVAMYAIDSLKQLSIKFLQKEELSNFNFQRVFLRPFEVILSKTPSSEIKDLVLRCIDIMIKACSQNIRSGWRTIFSSLEVAAGQDDFDIARLAFTILEGLLQEKFEMITHDFVELMNCLVGFASCQHSTLSLKSIAHLITCAAHLGAGRINPTIEQHSASDTRELSWDSYRNEMVKRSVGDEQSSVFRLWWPLLLGLSTRVSDNRPSVRNEAFAALRSILGDHGSLFSIQTWAVIFKGVLFPIIDTAKSEDSNTQRRSSADKQSWMDNMAEKVLSFCVDCYLVRIREDVSKAMFKDLLQMLNSCIILGIPSLSATALRVLHSFVLKLAGQGVNERAESISGDVDSLHVEIIINQEISLALSCIPFEFLQSRDISSILPHRCSLSVAQTLLGLQKTKFTQVQTNYGRGRVLQVSNRSPKTAKILEIELDWNAILYAPSESVTHLAEHLDFTPAEIEKRFEVQFPVLKTILHQVVALLDETLLLFQIRLENEQFDGVLNSLEAIFWYSYIFNRETMRNLSFGKHNTMASVILNKYLGEVELVSMQTLLKWVFALYLQGTQNNIGCNCESRNDRLRRIVELVHERYDGSNMNPVAYDSEDEDEDGFMNEDSILSGNSYSDSFLVLQERNHSTYIACIKIILGAVLEFSIDQFQEHKSWLMERMTGLITSSNVDIRILLRKIYRNYVNKILLNM